MALRPGDWGGMTAEEQLKLQHDGRPQDKGDLLDALKREHPERWRKILFDLLSSLREEKARRAIEEEIAKLLAPRAADPPPEA